MCFCLQSLDEFFLKCSVLHFQNRFFELVGVSIILESEVELLQVLAGPQLIHLEGSEEAEQPQRVSSSQQGKEGSCHRPVVPLVDESVEPEGQEGSVAQQPRKARQGLRIALPEQKIRFLGKGAHRHVGLWLA